MPVAPPPGPLRLLWVATKSPWPPADGGRLLQLETLRLLAEVPGEIAVELVGPAPRRELAVAGAALSAYCRPHLVAARPRPLALAALLGAVRGLPVTAARHALPAVARRVAAVARSIHPDLVHAEQAQAMAQARAAARPIVLRAQNVESALWRGEGEGRGGLSGTLRRREAVRVDRWEAEMIGRAARTLAVSEEDAQRLAASAPGSAVLALPAPFPATLPPGAPLPGEPAVVLFVGAGWSPNRQGAERFLRGTWQAVRQRLPGAVLHLFGSAGAAGEGVVCHPAPREAATAFARGSLLVVPLAVASGVRMKILEAWARGVPVAATPAAAAGLAATAGVELLVAELGPPLVEAVVALATDQALRQRLVPAARSLLVRRHDPRRVRDALLAHYRDVAPGAPRG